HPLTIAAAGDIADPVFVFRISANGLADAARERLLWGPIQFALDFASVHRVAPVVAGAVFDERDEFVVGNGGVVRAQFIQQFANRADNFQVLFFTASTNVVGFSDAAVGKHGANG